MCDILQKKLIGVSNCLVGRGLTEVASKDPYSKSVEEILRKARSPAEANQMMAEQEQNEAGPSEVNAGAGE